MKQPKGADEMSDKTPQNKPLPLSSASVKQFEGGLEAWHRLKEELESTTLLLQSSEKEREIVLESEKRQTMLREAAEARAEASRQREVQAIAYAVKIATAFRAFRGEFDSVRDALDSVAKRLDQFVHEKLLPEPEAPAPEEPEAQASEASEDQAT